MAVYERIDWCDLGTAVGVPSTVMSLTDRANEYM
jgi:hypothetical protein